MQVVPDWTKIGTPAELETYIGELFKFRGPGSTRGGRRTPRAPASRRATTACL